MRVLFLIFLLCAYAAEAGVVRERNHMPSAATERRPAGASRGLRGEEQPQRKRRLDDAAAAAAAAAVAADVGAAASGTGKVDEYAAFDLNKAIRRAQYTANLIHQRFELWHPRRYLFFLYIQNIPEWGWDILKYKLALKTLLPNGAKAAPGGEGSNGNSRPSTSSTSASSNNQKEFLYIFGGSSVTAGHDNWFNESYPMVFQRRLQGTFDALGVPLHVHNIAQGANNCFPSDYCYASMGGAAADFINWEQSYNCGKAPNVYELMAREAAWTDAVLHFSASGAFKPDCELMPLKAGGAPGERETAWTHERWTPAREGLREGQAIPHAYRNTSGYDGPHLYHYYAPNVTRVRQLKELLHVTYMEANPVGRFTGLMWPSYNGVAPHGFSVWTKGSEGDALALKGLCYHEGGPHWMTQETALFSRGHGASWHPPAGMHLLRGEILTYNYLHVFLDAMYMLRDDIAKSVTGSAGTGHADEKIDRGEGLELQKRDALIAKYRAALLTLQKPMPVKPLRASPDGDRRPVCNTNFKPHYNERNLLSARVVGTPVGWEYVLKTGSTSHMDSGLDWGYLDRRPCYESVGKPDSTISFKIEVNTAASSLIKICSYDHKEGLKTAHFYLHAYHDPPCSQCGDAGSGSGESPRDAQNPEDQPWPVSAEEGALDEQYHWTGPERRSRALADSADNTQRMYHDSSLSNSTAYVLPPLSSLQRLTSRKYHGDECHAVLNLPLGRHVLTVATHSSKEVQEGKRDNRHVYSVSHIIEWD